MQALGDLTSSVQGALIPSAFALRGVSQPIAPPASEITPAIDLPAPPAALQAAEPLPTAAEHGGRVGEGDELGDINRRAVANTLANAFRNGVSERVTGAEVDLYTYEPDERYDLVAASLYQMPVDPFEGATHRPPDFWGRNLLDHLIGLLPSLLAEGGRAYLMQLSILGQLRTAELAEANGLNVRVVDVGFFPMSELFLENREQIKRVEQLSDAWHLELGDQDVMAAYLLELAPRW